MKPSNEELLTALYRLSGMSVSLYDKGFHGLPCAAMQKNFPRLCSRLHQLAPETLGRCFSSDMAMRKACDRSGAPQSGLCPFGLYEILVPIRNGSATEGYVFLGKSLPVGEEAERRLRATLASFPVLAQNSEEIDRLIAQLPRHTPEEYEALSAVLFAVAQSLAARGEWIGNLTAPLAQRILRYLRVHYGETVTLASMSLYFHCSTVTLTEAFRKEYGDTIMRTLETIRMTHAAELLEKTDLTVSEIAGSCGYLDAGYFSKRFDKRFGASPSAYREARAKTSSL